MTSVVYVSCVCARAQCVYENNTLERMHACEVGCRFLRFSAAMSLGFVDFREGVGETFGGLSGMLRQILSPSPETGEAGLSIGCNFLQSNSIFSNQSSMVTSTLQPIPPHHLSTIYPEHQTMLMDRTQLLLESHLCPSCGLEFRSALKLNYHIKTSHPSRLEYEQQQQQQQNIIENPARYTCTVCSRSFFILSHLKMHELTHVTATAAATPSCPSTSTTTSLAPIKVEKTFACDRCQASFRYRTLLERHRRMHEVGQEKPYSCPRCLMRFETRNLYNHHAKTHRPIVESSDRISEVNVSLTLDSVSTNVVTSGGGGGSGGGSGGTGVAGVASGGGCAIATMVNKSITSYPCDSCSKQFTSIESLTTHKAVHRSRPLVCDVCGKGFTHRKYYVVHQRIHTGERPYLCAMCGKSFTQASTLTVHRRYHTGERPYTCTLCGKGFVTRTIMLNHMKKH